LLALASGAGCGNSTTTGELGKAAYQAQNCGGVLSDLAGCDLKRQVAIGGLFDLRVSRASDGSALSLRSEQPDILKVDGPAGSLYTLSGQSAGRAVLTAYDSSGDVDRLTVQVAQISQISYTTLSNGFGTFKLQPNGDIDGTFLLGSGVTNFSLLFLQVDEKTQPMLGRDSFTYELTSGLMFQPGKEQPHAMQFELARPAPGTYALTVRAKYGPGRFKMQVTAN
jgi:hypothetical protein